MTTRTELGGAPVPAPAPEPWELVVDLLLRLAGGAVAFAGGVVGAVLAVILVPLRLDLGTWAPRVPAAVLLAVAGNVLLLWFAREATGTRWGVLVPAVGWFAVMLPALGSATNGSRLLMPNDWVGLLTLFGGTIVLSIGVVVTLATYRSGSPARPAG